MLKENWTYRKLGEVCEVSAGQGAPQGEENYCAEGIPFVKAGNIEELISGIDENCIQKVNDSVAKSHKLKLYKAGSVVFAKSGMSCMKGLVYTLKHDCYVVSHLAVLTPKEVESSFLNYALKYFKPNKLIKDEAYPSISLGDISNFSIPVPPLDIQSHIVSELDLLQSLINKQQAQLKELDNLAQAVFYDMFGDPVENEKGWEVKKLEDCCAVGSSRRIFAEEYVNEGIPFYRSKEIIELSKKKPISVELYISENRFNEIKQDNGMPTIGDLLITAVGTIGEIWIVDSDKPFYFKDGNIIWLSKICPQVHPLFLQYSLNKLIDECKKKMAIGSAYSALTIINFKKLVIVLPPISLQQSFAKKIESIEMLKSAISQSIAETQKLFDYTMDKYFG